MTNKLGVVVIGRNEGSRLKTCLESVVNAGHVVYVDSGSTDNSVDIAEKLGVTVVNLDLSVPFTAARARNEGFQRLSELEPDITYVQFVDGDCEVVNTWLEKAVAFLDKNENVAVVCGRRRERFPEASVYNQLCDIEWNTPTGEAKACGGDALMRATVFQAVGGYNPYVIAGEEPELCVRIRQQGWKIWRLDEEMTLHDANITKFSQWWKRNIRTGYAYALGAQMHGASNERHKVKEIQRTRIWGGYIPLSIVIATIIQYKFAIATIIYPIQIIRIALKNSNNINNKWAYAFYITVGKFPEMVGQLKFFLDRCLDNRSKIIEYKN